MTASPEARASKTILDGRLNKIPGVESLRGDQMPFVIQSGRMTLATSALANQGPWTAPCDMQIVGAVLNKISAATATSGGAMTIGTSADGDSLLDSLNYTATETGTRIVTATEFASVNVEQGETVEFGLDAASAAGGVVAAALILVPR